MVEIKTENIGELVKSIAEQKTNEYTSFTPKQIVAYGNTGEYPWDFSAWRIWQAGGHDQIQSRLHLYRPSVGLLKKEVVTIDGLEMHSRFNMFTMEVYHQFVRAKFQDKWYNGSFELGMEGHSYFAQSHYQSKDKRKDHERILASLDANEKFNLNWIPDEPILIDFLKNTARNEGEIWAPALRKLEDVYVVLGTYSSIALDIMERWNNNKNK